MAADEPSTPGPAPTLRVRLSGPRDRHAHAAWALEALLARIRVRDWQLVDEAAAADLVWGARASSGAAVDLPADPAAWDFAWDLEPDPDSDPLAFTFWWLARVEEQLAPAAAFDEHDRFRFATSALARRDDPLAAPVDELARSLAPRLERWRAPQRDDEPAWRVVATHDVDLPWRWTRQGRRRALRRLRDELRQGRIMAAIRTMIGLAASPLADSLGDPWDNFEQITQLEDSLDARSTSYLLVAGHVPEDGDEELLTRGERYVRRRHVDDTDGFDERLGLHGSYTSSEVDGRLARELAEVERRLGVPTFDHRFHYLRHRPVDAWPRLDELGVRTDSSLGHPDHPGFRAGTAHPFRAWDHAASRPLALVVIPLAVMDASYDQRYLALGRRERLRHMYGVLDRIRDLGGSASLLVHNDRLCNIGDDGWTRQYRTILRRIRRDGGVACTAAAAAAAYRDLLPPARR